MWRGSGEETEVKKEAKCSAFHCVTPVGGTAGGEKSRIVFWTELGVAYASMQRYQGDSLETSGLRGKGRAGEERAGQLLSDI